MKWQKIWLACATSGGFNMGKWRGIVIQRMLQDLVKTLFCDLIIKMYLFLLT